MSNAFCPSSTIHLPSPREPAGCNAPATQVEQRKASGREAVEALAEGQGPSSAGDKPGVFRSPSRRKGAGSPCSQQWDATGILSVQLSSSLPSHRGAQTCQTGTAGDKDRATSPAALSSWHVSQSVLAELPGSQQPRSGGCKGLTLLEFISRQNKTPKHLGSLKPSLGTLRSEQEREKL